MLQKHQVLQWNSSCAHAGHAWLEWNYANVNWSSVLMQAERQKVKVLTIELSTDRAAHLEALRDKEIVGHQLRIRDLLASP